MLKYFITAKHKQTLRDLLAAHLPGKYNADEIIQAGGVWLHQSQRETNPLKIVEKSETVKVYISSSQGMKYKLDTDHIVFENNDLLVCYKPGNVNVHAVPSCRFNNLAYGVKTYLNAQKNHYDPVPLTRLDRVAEGLVLFAKNKTAETVLSKMIQQRCIQKWYAAALEKSPKTDDCLYVQDKISHTTDKAVLDDQGKLARSLFIPTRPFTAYDLYSVFIFTGRRHQIRFHAANYLKPIMGDRLYGSSVQFRTERIALMCRGYNFLWQGKNLRLRVKPTQWQRFLNELEISKKEESTGQTKW